MNSVLERIAKLSFGRRNGTAIPHKFTLLLHFLGFTRGCIFIPTSYGGVSVLSD